MRFVGQILIKLEKYFIRRFFSRFDVLLGVIYANMLVTTQWPFKRAPHLPGPAWYGGLEAHWSYLRYVFARFTNFAIFLDVLVSVLRSDVTTLTL